MYNKFPSLSNNPAETFENLHPTTLSLLNVLMHYSKKDPYIPLSQKTMGKRIGRHERVARGHLRKLEALGLCIVHERRRKNSNITVLNPEIFDNPTWYAELKNWFRIFPSRLFAVSLAFSSIPSPQTAAYIRHKEIREEKSTVINTNSSLNTPSKEEERSENSPPSVIIYKNRAQPRSSDPSGSHSSIEKGEKVSNVDNKHPNHDQVRGVCKALNARGAHITNDECLNFLAYEKDVLDKACAIMKASEGIESPAAFFSSTCRKLTIERGEAPKWGMVRTLRDNNYVILRTDEERVNRNGHLEQQQSKELRYPKRKGWVGFLSPAEILERNIKQEAHYKAKTASRVFVPDVRTIEKEVEELNAMIAKYKDAKQTRRVNNCGGWLPLVDFL